MKIIKRLLIVLIIIFTVLYHLDLGFQSIFAEKYSYFYFLLIPSIIKEVPLLKPVGSPTYYSRPLDGLKPDIKAVYYQTQADKQETIKFYKDYFVKNGYKEITDKQDEHTVLSFEVENSFLFVSFGYGDCRIDKENCNHKKIGVELVFH
jgi:hypothetical protein